jgi:PAS domain S-box-containing protein
MESELMAKKHHMQEEGLDETTELKSRLEETEETLRAIRQYMVDAFVVNRENGIQVVTLNESEIPYRMMVESMNEGAVTLISDGTIFYCNSRFGEMVQRDCEKLIGSSFQGLIVPEQQRTFELFLRNAGQASMRGEFHLQTVKGDRLPVQLSIYQLGGNEVSGLAIIATDLSERVQAEEKIRSLAYELTRAEQEERQRISQVLHDDLQQRLFAIKAQLAFLIDLHWKDQVSADAYRELDQIQASLSESIAITRNLSIDLSPIVLQGEGMSEAMTWLSFRMKEQYGLHMVVEAKENFTHLNQHVRMLLFQSVRELLFNVVKHAGTSEAKVTLEQIDGYSRITVGDHGKGFDVEAIMKDPRAAHGLLIIRDRLKLLGCRMQIRSRSGEGTEILIEIPHERATA